MLCPMGGTPFPEGGKSGLSTLEVPESLGGKVASRDRVEGGG